MNLVENGTRLERILGHRLASSLPADILQTKTQHLANNVFLINKLVKTNCYFFCQEDGRVKSCPALHHITRKASLKYLQLRNCAV